MELTKTKTTQWRPGPFPCPVVYDVTKYYFVGFWGLVWIRYKTKKQKIKPTICQPKNNL